jgi:hypothetical protein
MTIRISYSKHTLEKMDSFGIERKEIEKILQKGMKWQKQEKWYANMYGTEIVFQKKEDVIFIITVYLERREE